MSIRGYCRQAPQTARGEDSVRDAALRMDALGVGCLVIVDESERPVGIVTDRDIGVRVLRAGLDPDATRLRDLEGAPLVALTERASLAVAMRFMRQHGIRRIPVTDAESGRLIGLLTSDDLLPLLSGELASAAAVVRAQFPALPAAGRR
jgi:CBS domain-containing protein